MPVRIVFLMYSLICVSVASSQPVFINEFMASNSIMNPDPDFQDFPDWIELYNATDSSINLSGYYITDNLDDSTKWQFPDGIIIESKSFLIIWADGRDTCLIHCHTNFNLQKSGEAIGIFTSDGILLDSIVYNFRQTDVSFGRQPDGGPDWYYFEHTSFNSSNASSTFSKAPAVAFSLERFSRLVLSG